MNSVPIGGSGNSAFGLGVLVNNSTGTNNTGLGNGSLFLNTTGSINTAIGKGALQLNISSLGNTAIGYNALLSTNAPVNTGVGSFSLYSNTLGSFNNALGSSALYSNTAGNSNNAFGYLALQSNTIGSNNVAFGDKSLYNNISGFRNTAIGSGADVALSNLTNATAIGYNAIVSASNTIQLGNRNVREIYAGTGINAKLIAGGLQITGGTLAAGNVLTSDAFGNATLQTPSGGGGSNGWNLTGNAGTVPPFNFIGTTDNQPLIFKASNRIMGKMDMDAGNIYFGFNAGVLNTFGTENNGIGNIALRNNTTGFGNVALGFAALENSVVGDYNTGIGAFSDVGSFDVSRSAAIGPFSLVNTSNKIRLGSGTNTMIEGSMMYMVSDGRFKYDIKEEDVIGLEFIKKLRPVVYNFDTRRFTEFLTQSLPDSIRERYLNEDFRRSTEIRQTGFIAQEVERAAAEVGYNFNGVHTPETREDNYSLAYSQFVVPLVKAVQELSTQNNALKQTNDEQAKINETLKSDIAELREMISAQKSKNVEGSINIKEASSEAKLYQNAPNPFSKTTTIKYSLPTSSKRATISITNMSGNNIKTFELNSKNGEVLNINGGELSAGTYIYTLMVDDILIDSKKMVLTK